jgi:hypothetical protein
VGWTRTVARASPRKHLMSSLVTPNPRAPLSGRCGRRALTAAPGQR